MRHFAERLTSPTDASVESRRGHSGSTLHSPRQTSFAALAARTKPQTEPRPRAQHTPMQSRPRSPGRRLPTALPSRQRTPDTSDSAHTGTAPSPPAFAAEPSEPASHVPSFRSPTYTA